MPLFHWLRTRSKSNAPRPAARRPRPRLGLETMEDRTVPSWVGQIGGPGEEYFDNYVKNKPVIDAAGNAYVVGSAAAGADLDAGPGVALHAGGNFVAKYTPYDLDGSPLPGGAMRFDWARPLYTASHVNEDDLAVAADASGAVYVVGHFLGTYQFGNTPEHELKSTPAARGDFARDDAYVLKLSAASGETEWVQKIGGTGLEQAYDVATDGAHVYVLGAFYNTSKLTSDFNPDANQTKLLTSRGSYDLYLLKLTADGTYSAVWQMGGSEMDIGTSLLLDGGTAYVSGSMGSTTVDLDPLRSYPGNTDLLSRTVDPSLFIASVDVTRSPDTAATVNWGMATPGNGFSYEPAMAVDAAGHLYVGTGPAGDVRVAKYEKLTGAVARAADGSPWVRQFGGAGTETVTSIEVAADGDIFLGGTFRTSADLGGASYTVIAGTRDGFLLHLNSNGEYRRSWHLDGTAYLMGVHAGQMYVTGGFLRQEVFPTGTLLTPRGNDLYLMVLDPAAPPAEPQMTKWVAGGSVAEGSAIGQKVALTFTVSLSQPAGAGGVTLYYKTVDGTAQAGTDYDSAAGEVVIAAGQTTQTITVWVRADTLSEYDETFTLLLLGTPGDDGTEIGRATGTINNTTIATSGGKPRK